jgi:hypothetical protein
LAERFVRNEEVVGSIPFISTVCFCQREEAKRPASLVGRFVFRDAAAAGRATFMARQSTEQLLCMRTNVTIAPRYITTRSVTQGQGQIVVMH